MLCQLVWDHKPETETERSSRWQLYHHTRHRKLSVLQLLRQPIAHSFGKDLRCLLWLLELTGFNTLRQRQNGHHFPDNIFKCISWIKMYEFQSRFHYSLFPRVQLTLFQHWFTGQAPSHYLIQWWPSLLTNICVTRPLTWWCHIASANQVIIGSDNGLSPDRH